MTSILVNGQKFGVLEHVPLSYSEIRDFVKLSGLPSMTMKVKGREGRTVQPGESVIPVDGMVFNVYDTGAA